MTRIIAKAVLAFALLATSAALRADEPKTRLFEIASARTKRTTAVWSIPKKEPTAFFYRAGTATDFDGAPNAYHRVGAYEEGVALGRGLRR